MPKINVVLPSGQVVSVDESVVQPEEETNNVNLESATAADARLQQERKDRIYGGVAGAITEAGLSAADTLTLGGFGKATSAIGGDSWDETQEGLAEEHPIARTVGEVGAMLAPTGWIGDAAKGVSELSGLGLASRAGEGVASALRRGAQLASAAGRAVEGGIYGVGAHIADSSVTGDPLTIEGAIESAGIGAILNVGASALMDHVSGAIDNVEWGARKSLAESKLLSADAETANAGKQLISDPPPSWNEFRRRLTKPT